MYYTEHKGKAKTG